MIGTLVASPQIKRESSTKAKIVIPEMNPGIMTYLKIQNGPSNYVKFLVRFGAVISSDLSPALLHSLDFKNSSIRDRITGKKASLTSLNGQLAEDQGGFSKQALRVRYQFHIAIVLFLFKLCVISWISFSLNSPSFDYSYLIALYSLIPNTRLILKLPWIIGTLQFVYGCSYRRYLQCMKNINFSKRKNVKSPMKPVLYSHLLLSCVLSVLNTMQSLIYLSNFYCSSEHKWFWYRVCNINCQLWE